MKEIKKEEELMAINVKLKNIVGKILDKRSKKYFSYTKQNSYLNKFPLPQDNIERSFFQYKCQMYIQSKFFYVLSTFSSWILYPCIIYKIKKQKINLYDSVDAIFNCYDIDKEILPNSLRKKYTNIYMNESMEGNLFDENLIAFIKEKLKKHRYKRYFYLKCIMKLSYYNYLIKKYKPKAIICYSEFSFTSSVLTEYCRFMGIKHINIMHGEKNFDITNSFCCFDEFYVWADFYKDLFLELKMTSVFKVELPRMFLYDNLNVCELIDYTYYLTNQRNDELKKIIAMLTNLACEKKKIAIRPHPRYTDINYLKHICNSNIEIENYSNMSIRDSIQRTHYIVSDFSTVLTQGFFAKKQVVIDDITNPKLYFEMIDLKYGIVYKKDNYIRLSELLERNDKVDNY